MTRRDLERRLAERLEPEPKKDTRWTPEPDGDEYDGGPSSGHLWRLRIGYSPVLATWQPLHFTEDKQAAEALQRVYTKRPLAKMHPPRDPLAVSIAIARALGILGETEGVDDAT